MHCKDSGLFCVQSLKSHCVSLFLDLSSYSDSNQLCSDVPSLSTLHMQYVVQNKNDCILLPFSCMEALETCADYLYLSGLNYSSSIVVIPTRSTLTFGGS